MQGLAGGNLAQAASGAAAPYLAEVIKQTAPDEASRIMAHAAIAGVIAAAQGNSALSGAAGAATTAAMGEAIRNALYGNVPVSQLSEEQKQTLVALGTVAAGLAGGLTGNSAADAVAGAQAGQNEISNNMFSAGMLQQMLAQETLNSAAMAEAGKGGANEQAALALTRKVKEGLDAACRSNPGCVLMAIVSAQSQQHTGGAGSKTETVPANDDLTGEKLVNPAQDQNKGTTLTSPDQSDQQSATNTGNTEGITGTGENTTTTPIPDGPNKDDLAYLSTGGNVARKNANEPIRFIDGVNVRDIKTGEYFSGTVDLKPTLDRIQTGGSYPHKNDGTIFQNRPDRDTGKTGLPPQQPGYYKEYVHPTPGISGPGPQRIVVGQKGETYYTNDHYKTFIRIK